VMILVTKELQVTRLLTKKVSMLLT